MTKSQTKTPLVERHKEIAYRTIDAPVTYELVPSNTHGHVHESSRAKERLSRHAITSPQPSRLYVDDLSSPSGHSHHPSHLITRSHAEGVTCPPNLTNISAADSGNARSSLDSCHAKTAPRLDTMSSTEARSARDVPLPHSRMTSLATEKSENSKAGKSSLYPRESVSQVSTRRSRQSGGSKHSGGHTLGSGKHREQRGHISRTSKK